MLPHYSERSPRLQRLGPELPFHRLDFLEPRANPGPIGMGMGGAHAMAALLINQADLLTHQRGSALFSTPCANELHVRLPGIVDLSLHGTRTIPVLQQFAGRTAKDLHPLELRRAESPARRAVRLLSGVGLRAVSVLNQCSRTLRALRPWRKGLSLPGEAARPGQSNRLGPRQARPSTRSCTRDP